MNKKRNALNTKYLSFKLKVEVDKNLLAEIKQSKGAMKKKNAETQSNATEGQVMRRLLALAVVDGKKQRDQVRLLAVAGLDRNEIAELLGTTPLTVSVVISNMRKEGIISGKKRKG